MLAKRFMDEIDAARAGHDWLDSVRARRCRGYPAEVQCLDIHRQDNGVKVDGGLLLLWGYAGRLVAQVTVVRDDANFTIVTGLEYPDATPAAGLHIQEDQ